jgi:predicted porin
MNKIISIAVLCILPITYAQAAQWSLSGSLNPSLEYDDNIFMRDTNKVSDYHSRVTPTLVATYGLEKAEASFSTGYVMDRYETSRQLDQDDPFYKFNSSYQTQRSNWGLGLSYVESSSRSDAEDDTGDFETNSTSTTKSISPSFSYQLTERDAVSLNANYSDKTYSTTDFSNSETRSLSTSWQHQFTERLNGGLSLSANNNKSNGGTSKTDDDTYNLSLTTSYDMSEIWVIKGSVGVRQLDSKQTNALGVTDKNSDTGSSLDFNINYKHDVNAANLSVSRSISPSSTGDVNEHDKISLSLSRQLSETLTASISSSYQETRSASDDSTNVRKNINVTPSLNWTFAHNASLGLSYKYRQQKESQDDTNVSSNAIMLTLNYNWDGFRVSR